MKSIKTLFIHLMIVTLVISTSCNEDEENVKPGIKDPDKNQTSSITKDDIKAEGHVEETANGYSVDGTLTVSTDSMDIVFEDANLEVEFNEDGTLRSVEGEALVPSSEQMFIMENPIKADVNFYTGRYINENFDIEILLVEDISYFIFYVKAESELNMTIDGKPVTLPNPLGGHITLIADFNDPMFFFSVGADVKGSVAFGQSYLGQIPFVPTTPVDNIIAFNARSVRGTGFSSADDSDSTDIDNDPDKDKTKDPGDGNDKPKSKKKSHKFTQFISAYGMLYQNTELGLDIDWEHPEDAELTAGYRSGLNGDLALSFPGLEFQVGQGSFAVVTEASSKSGVIAKGFFNGIVDPDLSWWPKFIPLKPDGKLSVDGYTTSEGEFDFGMAGTFGIELPEGTYQAEGELRSAQKISFIAGEPVVENLFTMEGNVINGDEVWGAKATFTDDSTVYIASPPAGFLDGVAGMVGDRLDSTFQVAEQAFKDLENASAEYEELELSIKGLRQTMPPVIKRVREIIDESEAQGINQGRTDANNYLKNNYPALRLCGDNIDDVVEGLLKPYREAITRLENSINKSNDTQQTRAELEAALLYLLTLQEINKTITVSVWIGNREIGLIKPCTFTDEHKRKITINSSVIPQEYVDMIQKAADNVKYLKETSDRKIKIQKLVDQLPSIEELNHLKDNINGCVTEIVENIGDVGFVKIHKTGEYKYFMMVNGKRTEVSGFNVFDSQSAMEIAMPEFSLCSFDN